MGGWDEVIDRTNVALGECGPIKGAADALKVQPVLVAGVAGLFTLGFVLYGLCGQLISTAVGFAFPAFESFKALESRDTEGMHFWLTYWVVFASLALAENMYYYLMVWFPFYYPLKVAFLPATRGADSMYRWFIQPLLQKNRKHIDTAIDRSTQELKKSLSGIPSTMTSGAGAAVMAGAMVGAAGVAQLRRSFSGVTPRSRLPTADEVEDDQEPRYDSSKRSWETDAAAIQEEDATEGQQDKENQENQENQASNAAAWLLAHQKSEAWVDHGD
eukprot:CAMPEP_0115161490 /NCGR_PEP_ID=MMETSP0227-20121206/71366_1 /TAXON_ID=89957 /ORGANISM="Polarella glacialis, Strain CCMP 1383" /LENGTH=272 /DNA_ID=CAMNT_0002573457 /DNA_START=71 /DNA_END=889 /DNA_ORIENTATION=+